MQNLTVSFEATKQGLAIGACRRFAPGFGLAPGAGADAPDDGFRQDGRDDQSGSGTFGPADPGADSGGRDGGATTSGVAAWM